MKSTGKTNGEITLSPADMNRLFNAMHLNSFDKKVLFPDNEKKVTFNIFD